MLQYRRRNTTSISISQQPNGSIATPLLTYCNWSYSSDYHIDIDTVLELDGLERNIKYAKNI